MNTDKPKPPEALALLKAIEQDHTLLFDLPDHETKQRLIYFSGFGKSHYTGAIVGYIWFQLERQSKEDLELRPGRLAVRFGADNPETIRRCVQRLVAQGYLVKTGRNTYRATTALKNKIEVEAAQFFDNENFIGNTAETPRTLALKSAAKTSKTDTETARRFKIHKSTVKRIANRHRTHPKPTQNATCKPTQNATITDTERNRIKVLKEGPLKELKKEGQAIARKKGKSEEEQRRIARAILDAGPDVELTR